MDAVKIMEEERPSECSGLIFMYRPVQRKYAANAAQGPRRGVGEG